MAKWFPDTIVDAQSGKVGLTVGRFVDIEVIDPLKSAELQKEATKIVPALESKIPGDVLGTAVQRLKPFNEKELKGRYPGAWDHYMAHREEREDDKIEVKRLITGTPLDQTDIVSREEARHLGELGFCTAEHLRDMSDGVKQMLGRNAGKWQKAASAYLART